MSIEVFVHQHNEAVRVVEVEEEITVSEFASTICSEKAKVWVEDADSPLEPDKTLYECEIESESNVHVSVCEAVEVKARYAGVDVSLLFSPSATIDTVLKKVGGPEGLKLSDSEIAKHYLAICDVKEELSPTDHVGTYADGQCAVCLDVLPKVRPQG